MTIIEAVRLLAGGNWIRRMDCNPLWPQKWRLWNGRLELWELEDGTWWKHESVHGFDASDVLACWELAKEAE